jgi:predicted alpha/beta-hydrolase family hydrolase
MLFVQGSRDPFGTPEEILKATKGVRPKPTLFAVPDGDHSFAVGKSGPLSQEEAHAAAVEAILAFISANGRRAR